MTYQRCGSNWLAQLAGSTGMLGRPEDWFNGAGYRLRGETDYPLDRPGQLARMRQGGTTANGVCGVKLSAQRCDELAGFGWRQQLGPLRYVHLTRDDRLARAISDVRAQQTGQYRSTTAARGAAVYNASTIRAALAQQAADEARIRQFFALADITPLELSYEELRADPGAATSRIAAFLGLSSVPMPDLGQITLKVQADPASAEWRVRFLAEHARVDRLPSLREGRGWRNLLAGR